MSKCDHKGKVQINEVKSRTIASWHRNIVDEIQHSPIYDAIMVQ